MSETVRKSCVYCLGNCSLHQTSQQRNDVVTCKNCTLYSFIIFYSLLNYNNIPIIPFIRESELVDEGRM